MAQRGQRRNDQEGPRVAQQLPLELQGRDRLRRLAQALRARLTLISDQPYPNIQPRLPSSCHWVSRAAIDCAVLPRPCVRGSL